MSTIDFLDLTNYSYGRNFKKCHEFNIFSFGSLAANKIWSFLCELAAKCNQRTLN